jgi:hypothetical protein
VNLRIERAVSTRTAEAVDMAVTCQVSKAPRPHCRQGSFLPFLSPRSSASARWA